VTILKDAGEDVLKETKSGDHLVLWYRTEKGRAKAITQFLLAGEVEKELLVLIFPFRELIELEKSLLEEGFPFEKALDEGRLLPFASEEFLPCKEGNCKKLKPAIQYLHSKARAQGRGFRLVGRIAPVLFERGDLKSARMIESIADDALGDARLLCLYDETRLAFLPDGHKQEINGLHTHSLQETDDGKVALKAARRRKPPLRRKLQRSQRHRAE